MRSTVSFTHRLGCWWQASGSQGSLSLARPPNFQFPKDAAPRRPTSHTGPPGGDAVLSLPLLHGLLHSSGSDASCRMKRACVCASLEAHAFMRPFAVWGLWSGNRPGGPRFPPPYSHTVLRIAQLFTPLKSDSCPSPHFYLFCCLQLVL